MPNPGLCRVSPQWEHGSRRSP